MFCLHCWRDIFYLNIWQKIFFQNTKQTISCLKIYQMVYQPKSWKFCANTVLTENLLSKYLSQIFFSLEFLQKMLLSLLIHFYLFSQRLPLKIFVPNQVSTKISTTFPPLPPPTYWKQLAKVPHLFYSSLLFILFYQMCRPTLLSEKKLFV